MYGDEQVCVVLVGDVGASVQFHEPVVASGIDYIYGRVILLDEFSKTLGDGERDVFFIDFPICRTRVVTAVTGIYYDGFELYKLLILSI